MDPSGSRAPYSIRNWDDFSLHTSGLGLDIINYPDLPAKKTMVNTPVVRAAGNGAPVVAAYNGQSPTLGGFQLKAPNYSTSPNGLPWYLERYTGEIPEAPWSPTGDFFPVRPGQDFFALRDPTTSSPAEPGFSQIFHQGWDISRNALNQPLGAGAPVFAAYDGIVTRAIAGGDWGGQVNVLSEREDRSPFSVRNIHVVPVVKDGDIVFAGSLIARLAPIDAPHLHFQFHSSMSSGPQLPGPAIGPYRNNGP